MGFYLSILFDIIFAIAIGIHTENFFIGLGFYMATSAVTTLAFLAGGMLVGKSVQKVLVQKSNFHIVEETKDLYICARKNGRNFSVNKESIAATEYDLHELYPYITIEKWKTKWYLRFFYVKDIPAKYTYKIILKLPVVDEA